MLYPSSVNGHLVCFHLLSVTRKAAVNIYVQVFVCWAYVFIYRRCVYIEVEFLGHMINMVHL